MSPKPSLFANMNWLDWLLALGFAAILGYIADLYLPVYGWPLGILAGLTLLYLAKTRRDAYYAAADKKASSDEPEKEDQAN